MTPRLPRRPPRGAQHARKGPPKRKTTPQQRPKRAPRIDPRDLSWATIMRGPFFDRCPPRCPPKAPRPQGFQEGPKRAPRGPPKAPEWPPSCPQATPRDPPRGTQNAPRGPRDRQGPPPGIAKRDSQETPRGIKEASLLPHFADHLNSPGHRFWIGWKESAKRQEYSLPRGFKNIQSIIHVLCGKYTSAFESGSSAEHLSEGRAQGLRAFHLPEKNRTNMAEGK